MPLLSALLLCLPLIAGAGDPDARGGGDATLAAAAFGRREGLAALLTDEAQVRRRRGRRASPRMLFLVSTSPGSISKAQAIRKTWGARLPAGSDVLFFSHVAAPTLPAIVLPGTACGAACLGRKEVRIWQWVLDHRTTHGLLRDFDFFVKADDDTFIAPLNMHDFLGGRDPGEPCYLGRRFAPALFGANSAHEPAILFNAGGAAYVLSRGTLELVAAAPFRHVYGHGAAAAAAAADNASSADQAPPPGFQWCEGRFGTPGEPGDIAIAHCLEAYGVLAGETRDGALRERFHPFGPRESFYPNELLAPFVPGAPVAARQWYYEFAFYGVRPYGDCCSERSVSYHYVDERGQLALDAVLYRSGGGGGGGAGGARGACAKLMEATLASASAAAAYPCWFRSKWRDVVATPDASCTTDEDAPPPPPLHDCDSPAQRRENTLQLSSSAFPFPNYPDPGLPKLSDFLLHKLRVED
jgi:hypothetical protein